MQEEDEEGYYHAGQEQEEEEEEAWRRGLQAQLQQQARFWPFRHRAAAEPLGAPSDGGGELAGAAEPMNPFSDLICQSLRLCRAVLGFFVFSIGVLWVD